MQRSVTVKYRSYYVRGTSFKTILQMWTQFITFRVRRSRGEMYNIGHVCLCVCLSVTAFPHDCTDPDVTWANGIGVPFSCALLGGFAIGARVSLL